MAISPKLTRRHEMIYNIFGALYVLDMTFTNDRYAVCRCTANEQIHVAGLAENAGTWHVSMSLPSATAEANRLQSLNDGARYGVVNYRGGEK